MRLQGSQSPKEKQTLWAASGSNSSLTVPVIRIPLQRKFLQRERQREKGGGRVNDNRRAEQTISSPDIGKLVLKAPVSEQERKALSRHATQLGLSALPTNLHKLMKTPFF